MKALLDCVASGGHPARTQWYGDTIDHPRRHPHNLLHGTTFGNEWVLYIITCSRVQNQFDEVTTAEVERLFNDSSTNQCGLDSVAYLSGRLKAPFIVFLSILALLINVSIHVAQASLPAKRAIIRPRVKKPGLDPADPARYRPISNLSFISKLVERVIHKQLSHYVESLHLLPPTQSGFRSHHSTETSVIKVYNDIVMALDSGFSTALLLLDFSDAFDCVDHSILLK